MKESNELLRVRPNTPRCIEIIRDRDAVETPPPVCEARGKPVECPACGGSGVVFPAATMGMWINLAPFSASSKPCDLCGDAGEVTAKEAEAWEEAQLGVEV